MTCHCLKHFKNDMEIKFSNDVPNQHMNTQYLLWHVSMNPSLPMPQDFQPSTTMNLEGMTDEALSKMCYQIQISKFS